MPIRRSGGSPLRCERAMIVSMVLLLALGRASGADVDLKGLQDDAQFLTKKSQPHTAGKPVPDRPAELSKNHRELVDRLAKATTELVGLNAAVDASFASDDAGARKKTRFETKVDIARGLYPRELRLGANIVFQSETGGSLREELTHLIVNYDYHPARSAELFGFFEMFSDEFLSIDRRLESGIGAKWEREFGITKEGVAVESAARTVLTLPSNEFPSDENEEAARRLARTLLGDLPLQKRYAILQTGLAVSVFREVEQAELLVTSRNGSEISLDHVDLPSDQRSRLSIRPSILVRPFDELAVKLMWYWKLPLDHTHRDGRLDYRSDVLCSGALKLGEKPSFPETVELVAEVKRYYDNLPPELRPEDIDALTTGGFVPVTTRAEDSHLNTTLKVRIRWK